MFDVTVNYLLCMNIFEPDCYLRKDVEGVILRKFILPLSSQIISQVLSSFIFSDDVVILVNYEVV